MTSTAQLHGCCGLGKKEARPQGGGIFRQHATHVQQTKYFLLHCCRWFSNQGREGATAMYFIAEGLLYLTNWVKATQFSFSTFKWNAFEPKKRAWPPMSLGLIRMCWLKCKQEYSRRCPASKHCVWNDVLIRMWTLIRVCSAHKRCRWIVKMILKTVQCCFKMQSNFVWMDFSLPALMLPKFAYLPKKQIHPSIQLQFTVSEPKTERKGNDDPTGSGSECRLCRWFTDSDKLSRVRFCLHLKWSN